MRASNPSATALCGHALTASAHLDLPSSESFSSVVSACSSSGRDTGGQRSRARAGLSFHHLRAWAGTLMPKISHITSFSPGPFILHMLIISLLHFLTPLPAPSPVCGTAGWLLWATPPCPSLTSTTVRAIQHYCTALKHVSVRSLWQPGSAHQALSLQPCRGVQPGWGRGTSLFECAQTNSAVMREPRGPAAL